MIDADEYFKSFLDEDQPKARIMETLQKNLSEGEEPFDIIKKGLVPALDRIGEQFSQGKLYIPELIFSGKIMKECLEWLKLRFKFDSEQNLGTIVLGTVKGDLHDIGKNLVGMIAEASGFKVVDIGIDIPSEKFLEAIQTYKPEFVGLSALLTTTMLEMKKTVGLIKEKDVKDKIKVIVGGAPVTEQFAEKIGADLFGKDAVDGVMKMKGAMGIKS
jgi:5-methyltetrahydrofolate--homocysteine methyltransferase